MTFEGPIFIFSHTEQDTSYEILFLGDNAQDVMAYFMEEKKKEKKICLLK